MGAGVALLLLVGLTLAFASRDLALSQRQLSFVLYTIAGAAAALIVGGALKSTGTAEGTFLGLKIRFTGPLVAWFVVSGLGVTLELEAPRDSTHTFSFVAPGGPPTRVTGTLKVECKGSWRGQGEAHNQTSVPIFSFPPQCHEAPVTITLESDLTQLQDWEVRTTEGVNTKVRTLPKPPVYTVSVRDFRSIPAGTTIAIEGTRDCEAAADDKGTFFIECDAATTRDPPVVADFLVPAGSRYRCSEFQLRGVSKVTNVLFESRCLAPCTEPASAGTAIARLPSPEAATPPGSGRPPASPEDCKKARSWLQHNLEAEVGGSTTGSVTYLPTQAVGLRGDGQTAVYKLPEGFLVSLAGCPNTRLFD